MSKVCSAAEAVALVRPGDTVASVGVIGWITPDLLLRSLRRSVGRGGLAAGRAP